MNQSAKNRIVISCRNVSLDLPVRSTRPSYAIKSIKSAITGGVLKGKNRNTFIRSLNCINLDIREGERIALIGPNGAGKSTFIRLISGIFAPTSGKIKLTNFATPLIDKSFFIDLDLSGYDACKASFLRYSNKGDSFKEFIKNIEEFSELGEFLSTPVSTYSEGMRTRLMFALTTSFVHPLLAMDEGIATGDRFFIKKALSKFEDFLKSSSTLILASHDDQLLKRFTERGIVFKKGMCVFDGKLEKALDFYNELKG